MEGLLTGVQDVFYSRPVVYDSSDAEDDDGSADGQAERETATAAKAAKAAAAARATERADRKAERKRAKAEKRLAKAMKAAKEGRNGAIGSADEDEAAEPAPTVTKRASRHSNKEESGEMGDEEEEIQMPKSAQRPRRGPTPPMSGDELDQDEKLDEKEDSPEELRPIKSTKNGAKASSRSEPNGQAPSSSPTTTKNRRKSGTTRSTSDGAKPKPSSSTKTDPPPRPEEATSAKASSSKPATTKKAQTPRASTQNGYARLSKEEKEKLKKPTDEELQDQFRTPGAMERYISSQWIQVSELKRLEAAGSGSQRTGMRSEADQAVITIKRGPFTSTEMAAVMKHLEDLKIVRRCSALLGRV